VDQQQKETQQQKQTIFEPAKIIAVGIAAPLASLLTSRFGISGTLLGLAISSVILTILVDVLKVYLARASTKVVKVPSGLRTTEFPQGIRGRLRALLSKVVSLPPRSLSPERRRYILVGSLIAAVISFLVGLIIVTGVEASVGKSLSCWMWNDCPTEELSADSDTASSTVTLPSILGGGPSTGSNAPQVGPLNPQQLPTPLPGSPKSPSVSPSVPPSEAPGTQGPVPGAPKQGREDQSSPREEDQQQGSPDYSGEDQQQSTANTTPEDSSGEDKSNSSPDAGKKSRGYEVLQVPWTT
jgi:hypothetical protein